MTVSLFAQSGEEFLKAVIEKGFRMIYRLGDACGHVILGRCITRLLPALYRVNGCAIFIMMQRIGVFC